LRFDSRKEGERRNYTTKQEAIESDGKTAEVTKKTRQQLESNSSPWGKSEPFIKKQESERYVVDLERKTEATKSRDQTARARPFKVRKNGGRGADDL